MPFTSLKIVPIVDLERTASDVATGVKQSSFIRWRENIPEKRGGWTVFVNATFSGIIRELHAWQGLNSDDRLAVGSTTKLSIVYNGNVSDITPQETTVSIAVSLTTTSGSNIVLVNDTGRNATIYDSVVFNTPVAIDGIVISGAYPIYETSGTNAYYIQASANAIAGVTAGGAVPEFTTTSGQAVVTVTLAKHGYTVGSTFAATVSTTVGGVTIYGQYLVESVPTTGTFTINSSNTATASTSAYMNGGNASLSYWITVGPPILGSGYGVGGYGSGGYGTGVTVSGATGTEITASDWWLDNWGEILISCPTGGPIFTWSADSGNFNDQMIPQAPTANAGVLVAMPQQQIMAWGSTYNGVQDPLQIRWCDVSNFAQWTPAVTNQAGGFRIPTGSRIMRGLQGPNQVFWWTDIDLYVSQYIGYPYVWGFNKIATGCGLIGPKAATGLNSTIYWMSQKQFFMSGPQGGAQVIPCTVWDVVFQNLNTAYVANIRAAANSQFNEVMWFFPSKASTSGENDTYVCYNALYNEWDYGPMARCAWIDQTVLGSPIGASPNGYIYQHETSNDAAGVAITASFTTGYVTIGSGEDFSFVDYVIPDMIWGTYPSTTSATLSISFNVTNFPGDAPTVYGPFPFSQGTEIVEPRMRGRYMSVTITSSDVGSFWRLGSFRYRYAPDGRN